ncbi:MAG: hypothetical protein B7Y36_18880 [Novosphingobium sp. 28-62-57]|uniref:hypothetical protein n=1 Tax=unclassified Novosphingobium TaxID=2644732 RepID=UPI000BCCF114|nr:MULTISPECIES: hypothetical protein [unclassified Novosphingobium]OYW50748.1 MAG: hypothetical protein B7Z34_02675 [Novosphingobium sp. 12-62-10]OYZ07783.1 MAG: hypothetical protein B7Y36_18880 [Novosphingobium sp. 28-62-57]
MSSSPKPNLLDDLLAEVIMLGGFAVTRADAHAWLRSDGHDASTCDYFAFSPRAVDLPATPLVEVRASIAGLPLAA